MKKDASKSSALIIGSGGREHALGLDLSLSLVKKLFFAPGNGGTEDLGTNVPISPIDFEGLYELVKKEKIDLVIVGPEDPLAAGIVDFFRARKIPIVGPTKAAAQIESSKIFARQRMEMALIPQPEFCDVTNYAEAKFAATTVYGFPVVLKVDGLAAGKGAFVCKDRTDLDEALKIIYEEKRFGEGPILVEECLTGQEMSVFVLCSENEHKIIGTAQDYKRLLDGDKGPNTGGMGSISPSPLVAQYPNLLDDIEKQIIMPIIFQLEKEKIPFTGFLYAGLMIDDYGDPYVIEFNCRMGDPETQVVLPRLKTNLFDLLWAAANNLPFPDIRESEECAAFVVKVASGYPDKYEKGKEIFINPSPSPIDIGGATNLIHAGTKKENGKLLTNGGRVIGSLGFGKNLEKAAKNAYFRLKDVCFANEFYRKDIGKF